MKKILGIITAAVFALALFPAQIWQDEICNNSALTAQQKADAGCGESKTVFDVLPGVLNAVFGIVGILAVGLIIFGGVRYTISQGDAGKVKKAKDTIMYAVIGLVVTLAAFAIVNFVLTSINPNAKPAAGEDAEDGEESSYIIDNGGLWLA